MSMKFLGSPSR